MALVETITFTVGNAVAKWIFGSWLGEGLGKELTGSFTDLLTDRVPDFLQRRNLSRQSEAVSERIASKLGRTIDVEYSNVAPNDAEAALIAAQTTLEKSIGQLNLFGIDLEPSRLQASLIENDPQRAEIAGLSTDSERLYNLALSESANYVIEIATAMPKFTSAGTVELLRRDTAITDMVAEVLRRLPDPQTSAGADSAARIEFETSYRRLIARKLDKLELFGLSVSEYSSRYALSVAYITLMAKGLSQASRAMEHSNNHMGHEGKAESPISESADDLLRIDDAISESDRIFVRGAAGSGKTTLLQWIAVKSARGEFDDLNAEWNESLPIFIQLRRFSKESLPSPEGFLRHMADSISDRMPDGWVSELMAAGKAIVLVDGVDEVSEGERHIVREWLEDLTTVYPDCKYVVTSRPAAVTEDWLKKAKFAAVELQPMTFSDIQAFVAHWHEAAARDLPSEHNSADLSRYQSTLIETIRTNRQIRNLATTPLLCAMLCALNRERRTKLPQDRSELYRIALEMLLDRRDIEREISVDRGQNFTLPEKIIILRELAYWLVLNEQSDAEYATVLERFSHRLRSMPTVRLSAQQVIKFMLVRSGLLREPVPGRIDFIHKTFQEYLAAVEVSELGHIPMLISKATEDNWREVTVLAAGACQSRQKAELLSGLLSRAEADARNRHTLYLLAVACMETAREVPPEIALAITRCLDQLMPPSSMREAAVLSSAGELALGALGRYKGARASEVAACIRTATLVGGEESLNVLAMFKSDRRVTVQRELIRSWALHDMPEEYARRILRDAPLHYGTAEIRDTSLIPQVHHLERLTRLVLSVRGMFLNREYLGGIPQLRVLFARHNRSIGDLEFLRRNVGITQLDLEDCTSVKDISPLVSLTNLTLLDLSGAKVSDISPIGRMTKLRWLYMNSCREVHDWSPLGNLPELLLLQLNFSRGLGVVPFLANMPDLEELTATHTDIVSLAPLAESRRLSSLNAHHCANLKYLPTMNESALQNLQVSSCPSLESLEPLGRMRRLRSLIAFSSRNLSGFEVLSNSGMLRRFSASGCRKLDDVSFLAGKMSLTEVNIADTGVTRVAPISEAPAVVSVALNGLSGVEDLESLAKLENLRSLDLRGIGPVDLRAFASKRRLMITVDAEQEVVGSQSYSEIRNGRLRRLQVALKP
jgi:hypothetical protein